MAMRSVTQKTAAGGAPPPSASRLRLARVSGVRVHCGQHDLAHRGLRVQASLACCPDDAAEPLPALPDRVRAVQERDSPVPLLEEVARGQPASHLVVDGHRRDFRDRRRVVEQDHLQAPTDPLQLLGPGRSQDDEPAEHALPLVSADPHLLGMCEDEGIGVVALPGSPGRVVRPRSRLVLAAVTDDETRRA
jgi:hypothetical protein